MTDLPGSSSGEPLYADVVVDETKLDEAGKKEFAAFKENARKSKDALTRRLNDIKSNHVSAGSSQLSERAGVNGVQEWFTTRQQEIDNLMAEAERAFYVQLVENKGQREEYGRRILEEREKRIKANLDSFESILNRYIPDKYVTTDSTYAIDKSLEGAGLDKALQTAEQVRENPDFKQVQTAFEQKRELTSSDYAAVIRLMHPGEITVGDFTKRFEVSGAGTLIGLMQPYQRYKLVEEFMKSEQKKGTPELIDAFLSTGVLNRQQGEELFAIAVKEGLLTKERFDQEFKPKFQPGQGYEKDLEQLRQIMEKEKDKKYYGEFSDNIMNRVVGKPVVGGLIAAWGVTIVTLNVLANRGDLGKLKSNPYFLAGLAGMATGTEIATGSLKKGAGWGIGDGVIGTGVKGLSEGSNAATRERQALANLNKLYTGSPDVFRDYLGAGGIKTALEVKAEKKKKGSSEEDSFPTLDELQTAEKDPTLTAILKRMTDPKDFDKDKMRVRVSQAILIADDLNIHNKDAALVFTGAVKDVSRNQRPPGEQPPQLLA